MKISGYSSTVVLTLIVCGAELALSHVGSSHVIVRGAVESFPSGEAYLVVSVDGKKESRPVVLPEGIVAGNSQKVKYF
jgi:hypothetical protein